MSKDVSKFVRYMDWKDWRGKRFGAAELVDELYFSAEFRAAGIALRGLRVLEIGFGNGTFARWAQEQGAYYVGTEAIPELVEIAQENGYSAHHAATDFGAFLTNDSVDVVVAFDVLEHFSLIGLRAFLQEVRGYLKGGGVLMARVPSGDSPFSRAIQHGDLTHRLTLGSSAVRQLADEQGFLVQQVREPRFPVLGIGARAFFRRSLVRVVRAAVFPMVRGALLGRKEAVLTPNMIFVLEKDASR